MTKGFSPTAGTEYIGAASRAVLDLLLPPHCPSCNQIVSYEGLLCSECFAHITVVTEPVCARCGVAFANRAFGGPDQLCDGCRSRPPSFARARAAFRYDGHSRRLILPFKHSDRIELSRILSTHMARIGGVLLAESDVIVPVPLHYRRLFSRRYNQSALLARELGRLAGKPVLLDGLVRRHATTPLGGKSAAQRSEALAGAIAVRPRRHRHIAGRRILLVDDVMTSGATANACAEALTEAGAAAVNVLLGARVDDPRLA